MADDDVKLMDALDGKIFVNRTSRICTAELTPGERVSAFGQLSRGLDPEAAQGMGYRSGAVGWVLWPPEGARMLISSYPIDRPFLGRARRIWRWAVLLLAVVIVTQASMLGYHLRVLSGQRIATSVTGAEVVREKNDDGYELKRMVTLELPLTSPKERVTREVTENGYATARRGNPASLVLEPIFRAITSVSTRPRRSGSCSRPL